MGAEPLKSLRLPCPAKLNLFLHVTGRRNDGYHELQTVFQLLDFGDEIEIGGTAERNIAVRCPGLDLAKEDNLAWRAARRLQERFGVAAGADIRIDKRIPVGGGLGGGSSNAATVLLALNRLWNLGCSTDELADVGVELGADVPVFVRGSSAWAEGTGECLRPLAIPPRHYLVIVPNCAVSTADVFSSRELTRNGSPITIAAFFEGGGRNDCESVVRRLYPEVDKALRWLEKFGRSRLTGSGACAFASFESKARAEAVYRELPGEWSGFVAAGIDRSPVPEALG